MNVEQCLAAVEAALQDADVTLSTELGGQRADTTARLWRGQVLVDWEPDSRAGGALLRPELLRRLTDLGAAVTSSSETLTLRARGQVVSALSPAHAELVAQLGGPRRVELVARLHFKNQQYVGGDESYTLARGGSRAALLRLSAEVRIRNPDARSPRTTRAQT